MLRIRLQRPVAGLLLLTLASWARAAVTVNPWAPLFQGIDYATGSTQVDSTDIHLQAVNALRIDLQHPNISFVTTPHSGSLETTTQTTRDFLLQNHLAVAVNANFWDIQVNAYVQEQVNLLGLAISGGTVVSPPTDGGFGSTLALTQDNHASIITTNTASPLTGIYNAISGNTPLLNAGVIFPSPADTTPQPRTAAGLTQDGRYLLLVTIDGRFPGHSDGSSDYETAQWMLRFGAFDAINLDGGGSTTMARDDGSGNAILMNIPSGPAPGIPGLERLDGNNFGIHALPLPEPASLATLALAAGLLVRRRRPSA